MIGENGNGLSHGGTKGGLGMTGYTKPRAYLRALTREVERAERLSDAEAESNIRFAVNVRDDEECDARARLRAVELLEAMRDRGYRIAQNLDEAERPKQETTVNVAVGVRVVIE